MYLDGVWRYGLQVRPGNWIQKVLQSLQQASNNLKSAFRMYTVSPGEMDFNEAHAYCESKGLGLAKWDTLEKLYDMGFIAGQLEIWN